MAHIGPFKKRLRALKFGAATSNRLRVNTNTSLDNKHDFTTIGWYYPTTITAGRVFWEKGTAGEKSLNHQGGNVIRAAVGYATTSAITDSSAVITINKWHYIAMTHSTATSQCQIFSGTLNATVTNIGTVVSTGAGAINVDSTGPHTIGNGGAASPVIAFQGSIAFFAHYQRVMSIGEIEAYRLNPQIDGYCDLFLFPGWQGAGTHFNYAHQKADSVQNTYALITGAIPSNNTPPLSFPFMQRRNIWEHVADAGGSFVPWGRTYVVSGSFLSQVH